MLRALQYPRYTLYQRLAGKSTRKKQAVMGYVCYTYGWVTFFGKKTPEQQADDPNPAAPWYVIMDQKKSN